MAGAHTAGISGGNNWVTSREVIAAQLDQPPLSCGPAPPDHHHRGGGAACCPPSTPFLPLAVPDGCQAWSSVQAVSGSNIALKTQRPSRAPTIGASQNSTTGPRLASDPERHTGAAGRVPTEGVVTGILIR